MNMQHTGVLGLLPSTCTYICYLQLLIVYWNVWMDQVIQRLFPEVVLGAKSNYAISRC